MLESHSRVFCFMRASKFSFSCWGSVGWFCGLPKVLMGFRARLTQAVTGASSVPSLEISEFTQLEKLNGLLPWSGAWGLFRIVALFLLLGFYPRGLDRQAALWRSTQQGSPALGDEFLWGNTQLSVSNEGSQKWARWGLGGKKDCTRNWRGGRSECWVGTVVGSKG